MKRLRLVGLIATALVVLVLAVSFVAGLGGGDATPPASPGDTAAPENRVRVEVLNAAGVAGLAREATERLRDEGFDVVYYGNARGFHADTSLVLDRVGDEDRARRVAEALGMEQVRSAPDTTLYVDVSVVVGRDWAGPSR